MAESDRVFCTPLMRLDVVRNIYADHIVSHIVMVDDSLVVDRTAKLCEVFYCFQFVLVDNKPYVGG